MSNVIHLPQPILMPALDVPVDEVAAFVNHQWHLTYDAYLPRILTSQRKPPVFARQLAAKSSPGWVMVQANEIIGYADRVANCIDNLWVHDTYKRRGIGSRLMDILLDSMREQGMHSAQAGCESFNQPAINFFRSHHWSLLEDTQTQLHQGVRIGVKVFSLKLYKSQDDLRTAQQKQTLF